LDEKKGKETITALYEIQIEGLEAENKRLKRHILRTIIDALPSEMDFDRWKRLRREADVLQQEIDKEENQQNVRRISLFTNCRRSDC